VKILSRYVSKVVFFSILAVLSVVLAVDVIAAIIEEASDIKMDYGFVDALAYVATTLPRRIYENIPLSALIGCLVGLGLLASNTELVIMRSAGVSLLRIIGFVLRPVMLFIVAAVLLGEYAVPYTDQLAEGRRAMLLGKQDLSRGFWNKENNEFIHVSVVFPSGDLFGVSRYQFDKDAELQSASFSASANFTERGWLERDGVVTYFGDQQTKAEQFAQREWNSTMSPQLLRLVSMEPESLAVSELYHYANYLQQQGQSAGIHWLAFWNKALQPLTTLSLVLIAVSFIFGPLRESTTGLRIFAGVVTGIIFSTSQDLLGPASLVYGFPAFWAVLLPIAVSICIGLLLLRRVG
jgi:lipopolysaccharide export system permease protein